MVRAIEVRALNNFHLYVKFDDGISGEVDLTPFKDGEVFQCWKTPGVFEKVYIDGSGIAWNENLDIDALNIYLNITKQSFEEYIEKQKSSHA